MDNPMALYETVLSLSGISPRDCVAAREVASADRPISESPSENADPQTAGTMKAQMTAQQSRMASDIRSQRSEIIAHRDRMMRRLGRIVSLDEAARDWIPRHAQAWRSRNGTTPCERASDS